MSDGHENDGHENGDHENGVYGRQHWQKEEQKEQREAITGEEGDAPVTASESTPAE